MSLSELMIEIPAEYEANVFGQFDVYIKKIERTLNVTVVLRGESMKLLGEEHNLKKAEQVFLQNYQKEAISLLSRMSIMHWHFRRKKKNPQSWRSIRTVSAIRSTASRSNQRHLDRKHMWMRYARK